MEALRQFLRSWLGKVVVAIILAPMALLLGVAGYQTTRTSDDVIASIGDVELLPRQLEDSVRGEKQRIEEQFGMSPAYHEDTLKAEVLDSLVDKTVLELQAKKLGLMPTEAIIVQQIHQDPIFHDENGQFSQARFETLLKNNGLSKYALFEQEKVRQGVVGLVGGIAQSAFLTEPALKRVSSLQSETRHVWLHRIGFTQFVNDVTITQEQISNYYNKHKANLLTEELVDLSYIVLPSEKFLDVQITDEELQAAYDAYIATTTLDETRDASHILFTGNDAVKKAEAAAVRIKAGEDFAKIAAEVSEDPSSASQGGKLGEVQRGIYGDAFDNALFALNVGQVTEVVKTDFGAHIIRLDAINTPKPPSLLDMQPELASQLKAQKQDAAFQEAIARINESAISGLSLADIAQAEGLSVKQTKDYSKTPKLSLENPEISHPEVIKQVFDEFNLNDQAVSVAITEWADKAVWVQSANHRKVREKTRAEAVEEIKSVLTKDAAMELAKARAEKLAAQVEAANDVNATAANLGISFEDLGVINRQVPILNEAERTAAFSLQVKAADATRVVAGTQKTEQGYSVLAIKKQSSDGNLQDAQKEQLSQLFTNVHGQEELVDYVDYVRSNYDININDTALSTKDKAQ